MPVAGLWLSGAAAFALLAVAVAVFAIGECLHGAVQAPLVADLADPRLLGRYMALSALSWQVGFTLGPALGGALLAASPTGLWLVAAARLPAGGRGRARARARPARGAPPHAARRRRRSEPVPLAGRRPPSRRPPSGWIDCAPCRRLDDPLSPDAQPAPHPADAARLRRGPGRALAERQPLELSLGRADLGPPRPPATRRRRDALAERFGWHALDVEDVLSKRQRPKVDEYPDYLFAVLHFPVYDKAIQRLNAAELDVFLGPDYLVTLPNVELLPVTRLFRRCEEDERLRDQLFAKGSGRLLYEVLDDLFDYCFPILDKIGHKLDSVEDDMFERRAEDVVRDLSNVKQEIISYRKIIKPERSTLRLLERRVERFLPEELDLYFDDIVDARRADLGPARQLQGGRRGARVDERVGDLAPPERRPPRAHRLQRDPAAADPDHERLRDERRLPGLRHRGGVLDDRRP